MIRKAGLHDVKAIHALVAEHAGEGRILGRALSEIYGQLRDFTVAEDPESGAVLGCGALHFVWEDIAEIRSLAVTGASQGKGLGTGIIEALLDEGREAGVKRVFVLTYRPPIFERLDFRIIKKSLLPHKIWADCIRCTKFPECDEIALERNL
ncbi:MAG: N-acetyltransferase [Pseudomonadota bacterium]